MKKLRKVSKFKEEESKKYYEGICELHKIIDFKKHRKEIRNSKREEIYYYEQ